MALVSGAGGALGGAVARALGREGATVVVGYRSSTDSAASVLTQVERGGGAGHIAHLDVTSNDSAASVVSETMRRYGRLDIVVNAAGSGNPAVSARFADTDEAAFRELLEIDLLGTFRLCRAALDALRVSGGGAIVNFASYLGNGVNQENPVNSAPVPLVAAKSAVRGLTAALARDLAPEIRVNAVAPGAIATGWEESWGIPPEHIEEARQMTPLKRMGYPEEIAEAVLFLASDGGGYMTGQVLELSGGVHLDG